MRRSTGPNESRYEKRKLHTHFFFCCTKLSSGHGGAKNIIFAGNNLILRRFTRQVACSTSLRRTYNIIWPNVLKTCLNTIQNLWFTLRWVCEIIDFFLLFGVHFEYYQLEAVNSKLDVGTAVFHPLWGHFPTHQLFLASSVLMTSSFNSGEVREDFFVFLNKLKETLHCVSPHKLNYFSRCCVRKATQVFILLIRKLAIFFLKQSRETGFVSHMSSVW